MIGLIAILETAFRLRLSLLVQNTRHKVHRTLSNGRQIYLTTLPINSQLVYE